MSNLPPGVTDQMIDDLAPDDPCEECGAEHAAVEPCEDCHTMHDRHEACYQEDY